ncbi:MAG: ATP-grasp domain-containing protein [Bradyrhizobiaceae bacterium]|nr:ATP-grasp domain-containing protein [Hyphomicrobiales bacterium]MBV9426575.1 ATP-grasp domain-containing protein [Bradyrhizobiaceae bacterium]
MLITAISGRALAASARRGGYVPLVADFFGDEDTRALAERHVRLDTNIARGIIADELLEALETLASAQRPAGTVWGTGFEDRPELLARVSERWGLLGNSAETVTRIKDPLAFAGLCSERGIPHPQTSLTPPADSRGWLAKRRGGAGGTHVTPAADATENDKADYFQRHVEGTPVSALILADGRRAMVLGFSAQWSAPSLSRPFRYGGAVRPAALAPGLTEAMTGAVERLIAAVPLVGLNSADFLVEGDAFWLLEINPRPGATLDIFEPADGSLFALHVDAMRGRLPQRAPVLSGAAASATVYATDDIPSMPAIDWPEWAADRQNAGTSVSAGEPVCTVLAHANAPSTAKALAEQRVTAILSKVAPRLP